MALVLRGGAAVMWHASKSEFPYFQGTLRGPCVCCHGPLLLPLVLCALSAQSPDDFRFFFATKALCLPQLLLMGVLWITITIELILSATQRELIVSLVVASLPHSPLQPSDLGRWRVAMTCATLRPLIWCCCGAGISSIVASWFISPICSGIIVFILFGLLRTFVLRSDHSFTRAFYVSF